MTQEKPKMDGWHEYKPCHYISLRTPRLLSREEVQPMIDRALGRTPSSPLSSHQGNCK